MLKNSDTLWGSAAKSIHWLSLLCIVIAVPSGLLMSGTYALALRYPDITPLHDSLSQIHHTTGFLILVLFIIRLLWRLNNPLPHNSQNPVLRVISKMMHWALYITALTIALSGWLALSVLADSDDFGKTHIWLFGTDGLMPRLLSPKPWDHPFGYVVFAKTHIYALYTGAVLLSLHVAAALWHHSIKRDNVLINMLPRYSWRKD